MFHHIPLLIVDSFANCGLYQRKVKVHRHFGTNYNTNCQYMFQISRTGKAVYNPLQYNWGRHTSRAWLHCPWLSCPTMYVFWLNAILMYLVLCYWLAASNHLHVQLSPVTCFQYDICKVLMFTYCANLHQVWYRVTSKKKNWTLSLNFMKVTKNVKSLII